MASVRSRRFVLRGVGAGIAALVAARGRDVLGFQGSGSISIQGFLCPSADAAESDCEASEDIFGSNIVFTGPNGLVLTLDDGTSHAVSHVWTGWRTGRTSCSRMAPRRLATTSIILTASPLTTPGTTSLS